VQLLVLLRCKEHDKAGDPRGGGILHRTREVGPEEPVVTAQPAPRVGLALGSGSARGWAHIGVIRALEQAGVRPDLVCGTSIGSLVGAAYAAGELDRLEQWALSLRKGEVIKFLDVSLGRGLIKGERIMSFFRRNFRDRPIEELKLPFAAVATSLEDGAEVWFRQGSTLAAVRASIAIPGLLAPVQHEGSVLVDGGLVNPVPVSLARAMGAGFVIAVDLSSDIAGRHLRARPRRDVATMPSPRVVFASALNVMQARITRSRLAGEPPDLLVAPKLAHFGLLDYHLANEGIEEGKRAVERVAPALSDAGFLLSGTR
jgi:NTE family protein